MYRKVDYKKHDCLRWGLGWLNELKPHSYTPPYTSKREMVEWVRMHGGLAGLSELIPPLVNAKHTKEPNPFDLAMCQQHGLGQRMTFGIVTPSGRIAFLNHGGGILELTIEPQEAWTCLSL